MSIAKLADDSPIGPDDELLVAYLDGELDRKERTALENRLLDEQTLRSRLQFLQAGWDLLDELPDPAPSHNLVETTLELAVSDIARLKSSRAKKSFGSRYRWLFPGLAACLIIAAVSYAIVSTLKWRSYQRELRDLAIAENLDAYNYGGDLELMRLLAADPAWGQMVSAMRELNEIEINASLIADQPIESREAAIAALPIEGQSNLYSRWERLMRLDDESRQRILQTAEAVSRQPDRDTLLPTMKSYAIWREGLTDQRVDQIESTSGKSRRDAVREAIAHTMNSISAQSSMKLDDESIERIYFVLREILRQRLDRGNPALKREFDSMRRRMGAGRDPQWVVLAWLFGARDSNVRRIPRPRIVSQNSEPLSPREIEMIHLIVTPDDLDTLELISGGDPLLESMTLKTWAEEAIRRKSPWPPHSEATLLQRYNELPADRRNELDLLPPKEMLQALGRVP